MIDYMLVMRASNRNMVEDMATQFPDNAFFTAGKKAWSIPVDIALPCAFQNELSEEDAKELAANGCWCCCEVSNMGCQPGAIHPLLPAQRHPLRPGQGRERRRRRHLRS